MLNPDGRIFHFPPDLLETTPFQNYFVPGILLAMIVGGSSLMAAISLFKNTRYQYWLAMSAGLILIGWILSKPYLYNRSIGCMQHTLSWASPYCFYP